MGVYPSLHSQPTSKVGVKREVGERETKVLEKACLSAKKDPQLRAVICSCCQKMPSLLTPPPAGLKPLLEMGWRVPCRQAMLMKLPIPTFLDIL